MKKKQKKKNSTYGEKIPKIKREISRSGDHNRKK